MPPRFGLLLLPPVALIIAIFFTAKGRLFIDGFDVKTLTLLHVVRIPVELTLYWLFVHKTVPQLMTFEGRNFDILCGLTAPVIYYFGYIKNVLHKKCIDSMEHHLPDAAGQYRGNGCISSTVSFSKVCL